MSLRHWRLALVLSLWLLLCALPGRAASPGGEAFDQGFKAFRAGDYAAALRSFLEARRAGMDSPQLGYNLGVTYYRLERYPEAENEFGTLARNPAWAPLAHYNLGLTAQRMGRTQQAAEHFERARRASADPRLRGLAASALEALGRAPTPARTSAVLSFGAGYDSNVTLASDALGRSGESDLFVEALAAASHRLSGDATRGLYAQGALLVRKHFDVERYDQFGLRLGLSREAASGRWQSGVGGYLEHIELDDDRLQQAAILDLRARRALQGGGALRARYQLALIDAGRGFRYLEGWQQRFAVEAGPSPRFSAGYELELNDRDDLRQGAEFQSYSPTRHSLFVLAGLPDAGGWRTQARGEYRFSRYNDPHVDNGLQVRREDDRYGFALRAERPMDATWSLFLAYDYYRNRSTLDAYDYSRHQLMAGLEASL
ncbi:MAG TPA: hypothetical protein VML57_08930 [Burkholderiales bacterium]|nr:hypothetical protein [Burkholderiales bacterium]